MMIRIAVTFDINRKEKYWKTILERNTGKEKDTCSIVNTAEPRWKKTTDSA